jgi:hypothetical protein
VKTEATMLLERVRHEDQLELARLETVLLPQRIGMAVAARMLGDEASWYVLERLETLRKEGVLEQRLSGAAAAEDVLRLLGDELALLLHRIRVHAGEWMNAAMRMEGKVQALKERMARLDTIAAATENQAAGADAPTVEEV